MWGTVFRQFIFPTYDFSASGEAGKDFLRDSASRIPHLSRRGSPMRIMAMILSAFLYLER